MNLNLFASEDVCLIQLNKAPHTSFDNKGKGASTLTFCSPINFAKIILKFFWWAAEVPVHLYSTAMDAEATDGR